MTTVVREAPHHRNLTCVKQYRCRRPECVQRVQDYERRRYRQKGYGTWQPLVDATPAREHIAALRDAGHSIPDIQKAASISAATIARILYDGVNKRADRIRTDVAARILAIPVSVAPVKATTIVDATGTRRRIQALVAMGWTLNALGPKLGFHPRRLTDFLQADRVLASTARRIAARYRTIQTWDPAAHGVSRRSITLARNLAAREGWHGPLAWEDIDDPESQPETDVTITPRRFKAVVDPDRVARLTLLGRTNEQIAAELGCHERTVSRARRRAEMQQAA